MNSNEPTAAQLANALRRDYARSINQESCGYCGSHGMLRETYHGDIVCVDLEKCLERRP